MSGAVVPRFRTAPRMRRPWERTGLLIKDLPVQTLGQLGALGEEELAARLVELGHWDPRECGRAWVVSDTNYMIVSFAASPVVEPYVQFLSSPMERTIFWEVASAQHLPPLEDLLTEAHTESLRARGFSLGRSPSNFRREVVIDGPGAARRVAGETLAILFDTFGYRGPQPLRYRLVADRVAAVQPVHTGLTARELAFVMLMLQCVLPLARGITEAHLRSVLWCFTDNMHDLDVLVGAGFVGAKAEGLRPN